PIQLQFSTSWTCLGDARGHLTAGGQTCTSIHIGKRIAIALLYATGARKCILWPRDFWRRPVDPPSLSPFKPGFGAKHRNGVEAEHVVGHSPITKREIEKWLRRPSTTCSWTPSRTSITPKSRS